MQNCSIPLSWNNSNNYTFLYETCDKLVVISGMASFLFHWPSFSKFALLLFLLMVFVTPSSSRSSYSNCLRSCVHCKEMYGKYFLGHLCAQKCIKKRGQFKAVCTDLHSIRTFLDLGSLLDYDEKENVIN